MMGAKLVEWCEEGDLNPLRRIFPMTQTSVKSLIFQGCGVSVSEGRHPSKSQVSPFKSRQNRNLLRNLFGSRTYTERNDDETASGSEKKMIFLRGSPCGRMGARKSLEEKRRESSAQGWVGDQ